MGRRLDKWSFEIFLSLTSFGNSSVNSSSNVNEVIRAVLNFFFLRKFHTHKKTQNANKQTKIKKGSVFMRLKTSKGKKVTYSRICFFVLFMLFVLLLGCIFVPFVLFVRVKSFCKKKRFETALMTSFTLLLYSCYYEHNFFLILTFFNYHNLFQLLQSFSIIAIFFITVFFNYHNLLYYNLF